MATNVLLSALCPCFRSSSSSSSSSKPQYKYSKLGSPMPETPRPPQSTSTSTYGAINPTNDGLEHESDSDTKSITITPSGA